MPRMFHAGKKEMIPEAFGRSKKCTGIAVLSPKRDYFCSLEPLNYIHYA
jgi:hypothetical protein